MNLRFIQILILSVLFSFVAYSQAGLNVNGNGTIHLTDNAKIAIDGSVVLNPNSQFTVNANDSVVVTEDWTNDGNMTANGGVTLFNSNTDQQIGGSNESKFYGLTVDKAGGNIRLAGNVRVDENLRLLKNTLVDIADDTLTIGEAGNIFTNNANQRAYGLNRSIYSDDGINTGFLRKEISSTAILPYNFRFPLVTDGPSGNVYNYVDFTFLLGKVTINNNAYVQVKPVATEHPSLQIANNALSKYWVLEKENINISSEGANLLFKYHNSEVTTNEGNYQVLEYTPPYPDGSAFWLVNPGAANQVVDINADLIYSEQVDDIEGDWTAGIEDAAISTYYSRADGDYDDPNTWSKLGFGGAPSTTIPTVGSDRVRIKDNTVTVDANGAKVNVISVEENSEIVFIGENYILADTIKVFDEATLRITSADGIDAGNTIGNMRSPEKDFSENVFYIYEGTDALQYTGNGLPATIRTLILDKATPTNILEINEFISIKDSLVIRDGILDIGSYSINGSTPNRLLQMYDGELRIRNSFPANYSAPYFTNGLVHFFGTGSAEIPTNVTSPAVLQYHNLEISGNRSGNVTFPANGQIKIKELLKISDLIFSSSTYQFLTSNSTVIFNKNGGTQNIPIKPLSPADTTSFLNYHNLVIDSTGNKNLNDVGNPYYFVRGDLTLRNQSTFNLNGYNIVVEGDWINQDAGSIFNSGTNTVIMRSPITASATNITSRDTSENNFYDLVIAGSGIVKPQDELKIRNDIIIDTNSTLLQQVTNVTLEGNWLNRGGTYTTNNAKLYFSGSNLQTVTNLVEDEEFDQMIVRNPNGVDVSAVGIATESGLNVNGDLTLEEGNIITNAKRLTALANVIRPGATPGHIDGTLWKQIPTGASSTLYEVGTTESYTPVTFEVNGVAGNAGLVSVEADTITAASSPISNGLLPANSLMRDDRNVRRQWTVDIPTISNFNLLTRNYNADINFVAANDLRNGADPNFFEMRLWDGSQWIFPERQDSPYIGSKTNSSIKFFETQDFGTYIVGEPTNYSFFSIANGDWSTPSSWSIERYGGAPTSIEPTLTSNVFIGDDKTITLNADKTNDQFVNVDSSGTISFADNHFINGTGEFRLNEYSTIQIAHFQGITTGPSGAVQMSTRNYNFNNHNRGTFEYTGTSNQFIGNGLPNNVFRLYIDKTANSLTFNQPSKTILDSLYIKDGEFDYNTSFTIEGNLRRALGADFTYSGASNPIIEFSGDSTQYINDEDTDSLVIYSVRVDKSIGNIILEDNSPLNIVDQLRFPGSNEGIIYARKPGNFVLIEGSVIRTGNGHINGPLIKNIPAGDASNITFEVGDTLYYSPFYLDMRSGTGSTAGYLSLDVKPEEYPYMNGSIITVDNPPIYPGRVVKRYWRLSKPDWSNFVRGSRNFDIRGEYRDSEDWEQLDSYQCADFAFNKTFGDTVLWESIWPDNGGICTDTRDLSRTPSFNNTFGNGSENYLVYTDVENVTKPWGSTKTLDNGNLLLGDFVLGNQNGIASFITFYSRQSGGWTDPDTWSTVSHNSSINVADTLSPTINFRKFPLRQYDNVLIDSGHIVTLDAGIGLGDYYAVGDPFRYQGKVGPNVVVKSKGVLDLDIFEIRGNNFKVEKGGTLIVGAEAGINQLISSQQVRGHLKGQSLSIEDSANFVFTAKGQLPENDFQLFPYSNNYCDVRMSNSNTYIERVTILDGGTTIMTNSTGDSLFNTLSFHDYVAELQEGQSYTIEVERESNTGNRFLRVFIDWNRDGDWTDTGELIVNSGFPDAVESNTFTVPSGLAEGYTQMRVMYRDDQNSTNPCSNQSGEAEDYSIVIRNPNSVFTQETGSLVPTTIASLESRGAKHNSVIELEGNKTIIDSLKFTRGLLDADGNDIDIAGDIIADTTDGFDPSTGTITFYEGKDQNLRGTERVDLGTVVINKDSNDINVNTNVRIDGSTSHTSETFVNISDNDTLTFTNNSSLTAGPGGFGVDRMYKVSGAENLAGVLNKEFNNSGGSQLFNYPLGVDTLYNPATLEIDGVYTGTPSLSIQLIDAKHPQRLNDKILNKYWTVGQENITSLNTMEFTFDYNIPEDTSGNAPRYYASLYKTNSMWEMDLGPTPTAFPDEINSINSIYFEGDWTAGESSAFFEGRNYYSRNTGNWNVPSNWSTVAHNGPPSSYYPGEITFNDTVFVDGHRISFNVDTSSVDTITVGGAFNGVSTAGRGIIDFDTAPVDKKLNVKRSLFVDTDGRIEKSVQLGTVDTLSIAENLINNGLAVNTAGVDFHNSENDFLLLEFYGDENSSLAGSGEWEAISIVNLDKNGGLTDSLLINSATLGASSPTFADYGFNLISGVLKHYNNYDFTAANDDGLGINMEQFAGIAVENGRLISKDEVRTDVNNTIEISGGEFVVGDEVDENFIFQDNTLVNLNGGKMTVAGAFDGDFVGATVRLNVENNSELKVLKVGATDPGKVGLNINAGSELNMNSGRIIVANAIPGSNADYRVNSAVGAGFTGGTVQIGDSTDTNPNAEIKVFGTTPINNLQVVGPTITALQVGANVSVRNELEIDNDATYNLSTNSLAVGGDITNYGLFDASNGNIADFRLLKLDGTGDQVIFNDDASGLVLHNLTIDKTSGNVELSGAGNSNITVHRNLEFSTNNIAYIDGSANGFDPFVELSPSGGSSPAIIRNGKGHMYGRMYRRFPANTANRLFAVGANDIDEYRPATITTTSNGNTAGLIGVAHYGSDHQRLDNSVMNTAVNIQKYWNINTNGFALGTGNRFNLKLDYLNPTDLRNSANTSFFEQFNYNPACPPPPAVCPPGTGTWTELATSSRTTTSITSEQNTLFGDVIIGEPAGITFYSIADGDWKIASNWSTNGYGGAPAPRYPDLTSDIVRIGDGKRIIMPSGIVHDRVRAVIVEDVNAPGELYVLGNAGSLKASAFTIEDECTLAFSHVGGIADNNSQGALQTNTKSFGVANYIFKSENASMISGRGFPDTTASITVDITDPTESVFTTTFGGAPPIKVRDSIAVKEGNYESGNRNFRLYGNFSQYENGLWKPLLGEFLIAGDNLKDFNIGNADGLSFHELNVTGGDINVNLFPTGGANSHLYVDSELNLLDTTQIKVRADDRKVILEQNAIVNRTGTGFVDGTMQRYFDAGVDTKEFAIGLDDIYTPVTVTTDNGTGGVAGGFDAIALEPVPVEPYWGNRLDPAARIERFWKISAGDGTVDLGTRKFDTKFEFPATELASITIADAVIRRETLQVGLNPKWYQRQRTELDWIAANAEVELSATSELWNDFGNFYIGEKLQRIFYSNNNGDWTDNTSWALDEAGTIFLPPGVYPNNDPTEMEDIVIVDDSDEIALDTIPQVAGLTIQENSTFEIGLGQYVSESPDVPSTFDLTGGTIDNKSEFGIDSDPNQSWVRFPTKNIDTDIDFIFSGTTDQIFGDEFPNDINSLTISNTGGPGSNTVAIGDDDYNIATDLVITDGDLRHSGDGNELTIDGDITTSEPLVLNEDINGTPICSDLTLQGSGANNQEVNGPGAITFCNLNMDRGVGTGIGVLNTPATVTGTVNLLVGANPNSQIFELAAGGDLSVTNTDPNAMTGGIGGANPRMIRTSKAGGSLCRTVTTNGSYTWPIGSLEGGNDLYAPAVLTTDATGADGDVCLKTNSGTNTDPLNSHNEVSADADDYITRYWAVNSATTTITGQLDFIYNDADIQGNENNFDRVGDWSNPEEGTPGSWTTYNTGIDVANNTFSTPATFDPTDMIGDWTLAELSAFRRIFFSRQTGNWTDANSWTPNSTHIGPIFGAGITPNLAQDSVVIGGGNAGVNNHVITLDVAGSVTIGGLALGTSAANTGTLMTGPNIINGEYFNMGELSTLGVGSAVGITPLGTAIGNIQTTLTRDYTNVPGNTSFIYNGTTNQVTGSGLPATVQNFEVDNSGAASDNVVTLQSNIAVQGDLAITQGVADFQTQTANSSNNLGDMSIAANARLRIGGTNDLVTSTNNFATYNLDILSIVEFYGTAQTVSNLPTNLVSGLGFCVLNNPGLKTVNAPLLIRSDLTIINDATLDNQVGVNSLQVNGSVYNDANIENKGIIDIGN